MADSSLRAPSPCAACLLACALLLSGNAAFATAAEPGLGACGASATPIHDIQGRGRSSPRVGTTGVVVEAVVIGLFPGLPDGLGGFFVQEEDADADRDPLTSEGLFVFAPDLDPERTATLQLDDVVRVRGEVQEFFGMTELAAIDGMMRCPALGRATPVEVSLPIPALDAAEPSSAPAHWERWEGMRVRFAAPLFVIDQYAAGRFGEIELSAAGRFLQPTQRVAPGPEAAAFLADDGRYRILLDDGSARVSPDPWPYLEVHSGRALRLGDLASELDGVLAFSYGRFRVHPVAAPHFEARANVPPPPSVAGALRVVAWNVENLFNGDGAGGDFPTRGAASQREYERQRAKVVATLAALDPDIVALVELENDGSGPQGVLRDLVDALRAHDAALDYRPVDPVTSLGHHAIAVGLLYRSDAALPVGPASVLDEHAHSFFDSQRNRPSLAQTFLHRDTGQVVTVVVNHFKSKGSSCAVVGDPDLGDGQGNCNVTRRYAARALTEWIASDANSQSDAAALILGDLNAYPLEDPIRELIAAGFADLLARTRMDLPDPYSYVFDGRAGRLDHALANPALLPRVGGAAIWNINADESPALGYRDDNPTGLYVADARRASDHDPVIVGLFPVPQPGASALATAALATLATLHRSRLRSTRVHRHCREPPDD